MKLIILAAALAGCVTTGTDAGCNAYAESRLTMPRPLGDDALARWVGYELDPRMTGTCR